MIHYQTSALDEDATNVEKAFKELITSIINNEDLQELIKFDNTRVNLTDRPRQRSSKHTTCCN